MINLGAEHENLDQKAYSILKNLIIDRKLLPGQKIPQEKLARDGNQPHPVDQRPEVSRAGKTG